VLHLVDCSLLSRPRPGPDGRSRYAMLEALRAYGRVGVRLTQGRAGALRRTGWRHYQDLGRSCMSLPGYLRVYCGRIAAAAKRLAMCRWSAVPRWR